jgi:hypothetical protein
MERVKETLTAAASPLASHGSKAADSWCSKELQDEGFFFLLLKTYN